MKYKIIKLEGLPNPIWKVGEIVLTNAIPPWEDSLEKYEGDLPNNHIYLFANPLFIKSYVKQPPHG